MLPLSAAGPRPVPPIATMRGLTVPLQPCRSRNSNAFPVCGGKIGKLGDGWAGKTGNRFFVSSVVGWSIGVPRDRQTPQPGRLRHDADPRNQNSATDERDGARRAATLDLADPRQWPCLSAHAMVAVIQHCQLFHGRPSILKTSSIGNPVGSETPPCRGCREWCR